MTAAATTVPQPYLQSYPAPLQQQARDLLAQGRLGAVLLRKYPAAHAVRSDKALYDYAQELKARHLRNAGTINKVLFDNKIHVVRQALGLHTTVSRVQGNRLAKGLFTPISRPRNWCEQALSTRSALRRCSSRGPTSSCA